jgi:Arc/MetJ family transcription regulator
MAELEQRKREDPAHRAQVERADAQIAAQAEERKKASEPVVDDLRAAGVRITSLWKLYEQPEAYPLAIPVLLEHLTRDYPERTLEDIGHALPFKPSAAWWADFKALYLSTDSNAVRDRLAAAMCNCATRKHYDDLLAFICNEDLGPSRLYFLRPINRIGNRMRAGAGRAVIESVVRDHILGTEATAILKGKSPNQ